MTLEVAVMRGAQHLQVGEFIGPVAMQRLSE